MNYFNYNGKVFAEGSVVIGPDSRAIRYGDGLFETMKVKNGELEMLDEHFARLWKGMKILQFDIPKHFTPDKLTEEIHFLVKKNQQGSNVRIRLNIFRGDGGLYDAKNHLPSYIIQSWKLPDESGEWNSNGLVLGIYRDARKSCDVLSNLKHNNYLPYVLAALKAKTEKWNDAIVLNTNNSVADTTIANIFLIQDQIVYTTSLSQGCVAGIMRNKIIRELPAMGWKVVEQEITETNLQQADEVFVTNSIYNLRWVQQIDNKNYVNDVTRKIYNQLFSTIH
jgi:branched-chain amino acid aminotransferase